MARAAAIGNIWLKFQFEAVSNNEVPDSGLNNQLRTRDLRQVNQKLFGRGCGLCIRLKQLEELIKLRQHHNPGTAV
jgi:hypothetical protein